MHNAATNQAPVNPAAGATYQGAGYVTACTLAKGANTNPGGQHMRPLVLAYWLTNQPAGQTGPQGYTKGTPAYYQYLAWYMAMVGGQVATAAGSTYTNVGKATGHPLGNAAGTQPGRAAQHARWVLAGVVAANAAAAAKAPAVAGTK